MPDGRAPRYRLVQLAAFLAVAALALTVLLGLRDLYRAELERDGNGALERQTEVVRAWMDRYLSLAPIYARDPRLAELLTAPRDSTAVDRINALLEGLNALAGTSDTYLIDRTGTTIAASNWDQPLSFVGQNFAFRPYFQEAMQGRLGRFFALGTTSGRRGYYFAAPVRQGERILGAIVVKVSVDGLEQAMRLSVAPVFVSDRNGVVVLAGLPSLRMTTLDEIPPASAAQIDATRQFDRVALMTAPIRRVDSWFGGRVEVVEAPDDRGGGVTAEFMHLTAPLLAEDWTLHLLVPTDRVSARLWSSALLLAAVLAALTAVGALILQRRRRLMERLERRERDQVQLERKVAERTSELSTANAALEAEVVERRQAEASLRQTQAELVEAGKLAALGQMSAALSHEFNQPLTAIRTYAENAIAFLEARRPERAVENLSRVMRLTERMAQLSKHLNRFARRSKDTLGPVSVEEAVTESLALLHGRIERIGASVQVEGAKGVSVIGGAVRLQHVLMNLVGNALDAGTADRPPVIRLRVTEIGSAVEITVEDDGKGIADDALAHIFEPFFSTKEVGKGLGLGLSISHNIVTDFGGTMRAENRAEGGARFTVMLCNAHPAREAAE